MNAQVVFDLPIDGPFDYQIPESLVSQIALGSRVKVSFGPKTKTGFVTGLLEQSAVLRLKPIQSCDPLPVFNSLDLAFAREFCAYFGCSLGEALGTMFGHKAVHSPSVRREHQPGYFLYRCQPGQYADKIQEIIKGRPHHSRFLILVPDSFRADTIAQQLKGLGGIKIGTRSSVFESDGRYDCVIMVDEEDASYKQEQMPMYETRQVLLMRSRTCGFDVAFVGISPSVELMAMVQEGLVTLIEAPDAGLPTARVVDLSNYKFVPGLIAPPVRDALDAALKSGQKSILVLNSKGSYRLTRCVDCGEVLKCSHCDSALIYSRFEGKFLCRHCTYTAGGDTVCPKCHKPSWRSQGIGVEQLQTELKKYFPQAKISTFERGNKNMPSPDVLSGDPDIIISTSAILRFQGLWKVQMAALIDFDAQLNRLDMRCAFNAFSLALHISSMAIESVLIQTRNRGHYVIESLSQGNIKKFYDEELRLRKEFGFSPFSHWIKITWRGKCEKTTHLAAQDVYNALSQDAPKGLHITPPLADALGRKRDQFRFNVMAQTQHIPQLVAHIRSVLGKVKRRSGVIVTLNVDP